MIRHHIVPAAVLTFVLAAAAPAAARFELNPLQGTTPASATATSPCSEICSGGYPPSHVTSPGVPSTTNTITTRGGYVPRHVTVPGNPSTSNTIANSDLVLRRSGAPTVVHVVPTSGGFDWGDAGIGAGSAFAATLLLIGGVLGATHLRRRSARGSARTA